MPFRAKNYPQLSPNSSAKVGDVNVMGTSIVKDSPDNESKTDRQCIENGSIEQHDLDRDWSDMPAISAKQRPRNNYLRALTSARSE